MEKLFGMKIFKSGDTSANAATVAIEMGEILKYDFDNGDSFKIISADIDTDAKKKDLFDLKGKPTFDDGTSTCDNFVLDYGLNIQFKPITDA